MPVYSGNEGTPLCCYQLGIRPSLDDRALAALRAPRGAGWGGLAHYCAPTAGSRTKLAKLDAPP